MVVVAPLVGVELQGASSDEFEVVEVAEGSA